MGLVDVTNSNNHAGIERLEASEKAEAILKVINEYRVYCSRFENLPTWDVLEFLNKLQKELFERYGEDVENGERDRIRNEYFLLTGKKPFGGWGVEEIKKRMEEYKPEELSTKTLHSKKTRWGK